MQGKSTRESKESGSTAKTTSGIPKLRESRWVFCSYLPLPERRLVFGLLFAETIPSTPRSVRLSSDASHSAHISRGSFPQSATHLESLGVEVFTNARVTSVD